jgi:GAF domain-containing protein
MYDHSLFLKTLSEFTGTLLMPYDLDTVLGDLADRLTKVLALGGTGVTLADQDRLQPVTAVPPSIAEVEGIQYEHQSGPCVDAFRTGRLVAIADLGQVSDRWPEYCSAAQRLGVCSVAGIPMRLQNQAIGALAVYGEGARARPWPEQDLAAAVVMADMATAFLINASTLHQQEQLGAQLQRALDSRVVIEQAKGMIAHAQGVGVDEAFARLRRYARAHNDTIRAVAEAVVRSGVSV